jgi:glutamate/aspartate transport system substrate-binding protein
VRLHHQPGRAPEAGGVLARHLPLQRAHAGEGRFGHQEHCRPAGQDGGHHHGHTSFRLLREADKGRNLEVNNLGGKDHSDSFLLVESGRAQAFVLDDILLAGQIANARNPKDFIITGESLRTENQSLMFRKDDPAFKALVDRVVSGMMKSGEMEKLYNKWFMSPIPPKGININYPLNAETKEAFANPSSKGI